MRTLPRIVAETPIGKEVPVTVWRDGKQQTVQAKVGELPDDQQVAAATTGRAGSRARPADRDRRTGLAGRADRRRTRRTNTS